MINKSISKFYWIKIVIYITDKCNFKCDYCLFWQNFWNNFISTDNINNILSLLDYILNTYINHNIEIVLTWWEPFLHKDFNIILEKFLNFNKISIRIYTNWYLLYSKLDFEKFKNSKNIQFIISYHFFEYFDLNKELLILGLKKLINYNIKFSLKFLVPNKENLNNFDKDVNFIINNSWIANDDYYFDFLRDVNWNNLYDYNWVVYKKEILNQKEDVNLELSYINWNKKDIWLDTFVSLWLNKFKYFKCFYWNDIFFSLNISVFWEITFWTCNTLNSIKFSFDNIKKSLNSNNFRICQENSCSCWWDILIKKEKSDNFTFNKFKLILSNYFIKNNSKFNFINIDIFYKESINFIFKYNDLNIKFRIEKRDFSDNLAIFFWNYKISYYIISDSNIIIKENDIDYDFKNHINKNIYLISKFSNIYKDILS